MNYNKSLSELLFEEITSNDLLNEKKGKQKRRNIDLKRQKKKSEKNISRKKKKSKREKIVARITKLEEASFLLIPKDEMSDFTSYLVQGALGKIKTYFSKEVKAKSQNADSLDDLKKDNSAENVPGLERGRKTLDISYNYVSNKLDAAIGDALKTAIGKGIEKNMQPLAILKQIQKPRITLAGKKYRFNFLNRGKKDTETISGPDIALFEKLGHAFFTLVMDDPTDPKQDVYYSNNDHILVFAYPIVEEMTATQFKVHNALYNVDVKKNDIKENFIHHDSLASLLFETTPNSEVMSLDDDVFGLGAEDKEEEGSVSDPLDADPQDNKAQQIEDQQESESDLENIGDYIKDVFSRRVNDIINNRYAIIKYAQEKYKEAEKDLSKLSSQELFCLLINPNSVISKKGFEKLTSDSGLDIEQTKLLLLYYNRHYGPKTNARIKAWISNNTEYSEDTLSSLFQIEDKKLYASLLFLYAWASQNDDISLNAAVSPKIVLGINQALPDSVSFEQTSDAKGAPKAETTEEPTATEPPPEEESDIADFNHAIINEESLDNLVNFIKNNNIADFDKQNLLKMDDEVKIRKYIYKTTSQFNIRKIRGLLSDTNKKYNVAFKFMPIKKSEVKEFTLSAEYRDSQWFFKAKDRITLFENFLHNNSLTSLLFNEGELNAYAKTIDTTNISLAGLLQKLSFGTILEVNAKELKEEDRIISRDASEQPEEERESPPPEEAASDPDKGKQLQEDQNPEDVLKNNGDFFVVKSSQNHYLFVKSGNDIKQTFYFLGENDNIDPGYNFVILNHNKNNSIFDKIEDLETININKKDLVAKYKEALAFDNKDNQEVQDNYIREILKLLGETVEEAEVPKKADVSETQSKAKEIVKSINNGKDHQLDLNTLAADELGKIVNYSYSLLEDKYPKRAFAIVSPERNKRIRFFLQKTDGDIYRKKLDSIPDAKIRSDQDVLGFCKNNNLSVLTLNVEHPNYSEETEAPASPEAGAETSLSAEAEAEKRHNGFYNKLREVTNDFDGLRDEQLSSDQMEKLKKAIVKVHANDIREKLDSIDSDKVELAIEYLFHPDDDESIESRDLTCTASKEGGSWTIKFDRDQNLYESYIYQKGLRLLLEKMTFNLLPPEGFSKEDEAFFGSEADSQEGRSLKDLKTSEEEAISKHFDFMDAKSSIQIKADEEYSIDEVGELLHLSQFDLAINVKVPEKPTKDSSNIKMLKSDLDKILRSFNRQKGLVDIKYDNLNLDKLVEAIESYQPNKEQEVKAKRKLPYKANTLYGEVFNQIQDSEAAIFLQSLLEFVIKKRYSGQTDLAKAVVGNKLSSNEVAEEIVEFLKLKNIEPLSDLNLNESRKRQLNEGITEFLQGIVTSGVDVTIGGIFSSPFFYIPAAIYAGVYIEKNTGAFSSLFNKLASPIKSYYQNFKAERKEKKEWINTLASCNKTITSIKSLIAFIVTKSIDTYLIYKHGYTIGKINLPETPEQSEEELLNIVEAEISQSITKNAQSGLFTEEFKAFEKAKSGKELSDEDLIDAYELKLDNLVMSYMKKVNSDALEEAQIEKENLAYRNRMDVMDNKVLSGLAIGAAALAATVSTAGVAALGYAFVGGLFGGKISGTIKELGQSDTGPKETAFNLSTEQNKQIMRLIVIELAKKALGPKAESLTDAFIYQYGLSLLLEGLNEEDSSPDAEEGASGEEGAAAEEEGSKASAEPNPDIRGQISWEKLSERLDAENFFLFDTDLTLGSEEKAARIQYHFGSRLAAITRLCFGVDITDVEKLSVRDAQALSLSDLLVKRDAQVGEPSLNGVKKRESAIKEKGDPIDLEEFGNLINHFGGDTAQLTLYLIMTGRLDSLLQAMKGSKQTVEEVLSSIGAAISGNMSDLPREMKKSAEEAIQNLQDTSWVNNLINNLNIDLPITVIFDDEQLEESQVKAVVDNPDGDGVVQLLESFAKGYADQRGLRKREDQSIGNHRAVIRKSKDDNAGIYRFVTSTENARRLVYNNVNFVKKSDDDALRDDDTLSYCIKVKGEAAVFNDFDIKVKHGDNADAVQLEEKIAAILIIKAMRRSPTSDFSKYQQKFFDSNIIDSDRVLDGKSYAVEVLRLFGIKKDISLVTSSPSEERSGEHIQQQNMSRITQALKAHHERHLELYKMWKSR